MGTIQKVLAQSAPAAASLTAAYTVPGATTAVVSSLMICNPSGAVDTIRVSVAIAGAADAPKQYIYSGVVLPGLNTLAATLGLTLGAGDVVRVYSQNGVCSFNLFGCETS